MAQLRGERPVRSTITTTKELVLPEGQQGQLMYLDSQLPAIYRDVPVTTTINVPRKGIALPQ